MLVCPDLDEVYLPQPDDLLVNLVDARPCIEAFLSRLGLMFNQTHNVSSALGPALHSAHKLLSAFGGKITLFQSTLPTLQSGDLTTREDAKLLGTPKESSLLLPANNFYKNFALDCSKVQICVDMFLFGNQYLDVATLSSAAKFTGGQMFYYPGFNQNRSEDVNKYSYELGQFLSNPIGLEAVLRVRCTRGIRANTYYGNFFLRSTDLIALPNVTPNHAYTVELALDEKIETSTVYFQTALLHTSCYGERRIRVMTMALPVTSSISELYQSVDQQALAAFIAKKAVDRAVNSKLDDAREAILYKCAELLYTFKTELTPANSGATTTLPIYANIALYPLLSLAMLKHIALRGGSSIGTDARTAAINLINILPADQLITYLLPKFYSLHDLSPEVY
jgi:protein transport protein SEC24